MIKPTELDTLKGCKQILTNYFTIQEFSANKISMYEKMIYISLNKLIAAKEKKK